MAQGKRRESRGVRGGKRAHQKYHGQSQDPRRVQALAEARASDAALAARMEAERLATAKVLHSESVRHVAEVPIRHKQAELETAVRTMMDNKLELDRLAEEQRVAAVRRISWNLGQARALVRQGYTPEHASKFTGWPIDMVADANEIWGDES